MNCVTTALMVSAIVISICARKMTEGQSYKGPYTAKTARRNNPKSWTFRDWQWYLKDTAISMNVKSAWEAGYTGKGVLVAVVDDGVAHHPDLVSNFNVSLSYDFLKGRKISESYSPGSHGTNCAGIIAGGNNDNCGVGIAYDAQIASLRIYDDSTKSTDQSEAKALSHKKNLIDIYSNSWGPGDMGWQVEGPGPLLTKVLEEGTRLGRHHKGSIFVFAAGNGGISGDSCAFSGYVNSIHTIAISAVNWDGSVTAYTEQCAAIMAVTYGQDMFTKGQDKAPIITTKGVSQCTEEFSGTSATTAMASGIIALALEANPDLTWRDVQHLIVRSSKPLAPQNLIGKSSSRPTPTWRTNLANLSVSSYYGFGLMDANKMVQYAKNWTSVPEQVTCEVNLKTSGSNQRHIPWSEEKQLSLAVSGHNCGIRYLEHVQVQVDLSFPRRGYLEMISESPSGTRSRLLYPRVIDSIAAFKNFTNWTVSSLHYWGEKPVGDWNIIIRNTRKNRKVRQGRVFSLKLILYGTREDPLTNNSHVDRRKKRLTTFTKAQVKNRRKDIPIHGGYTQWSRWSHCSKPCEWGNQDRSRTCTNPPPANKGRGCLGEDIQSRRCNSRRCPVNGGYSQWTSWSGCSRSCGQETEYRYRFCTNPWPAYGGLGCSHLGPREESRSCNNKRCPVHGGFSQWSVWSHCSQSCGPGNKRRHRYCTNPRPAYGGRWCGHLGPWRESQKCNVRPCPVDGRFSDWSSWSQCSVTCDNGTQKRNRSCSNPPPANGGKQCKGPTQETQICSYEMCPKKVSGGYSDWSAWSLCSITCGNGTQQRNRSCNKSQPRSNGTTCTGPAQETRLCPFEMCPTPVAGGYSDWSPWSQCSVTCGNGFQQRNRSCTNPPPANNGTTCRGPEKESRTCAVNNCNTLVVINAERCQDYASRGMCTEWKRKDYCKSVKIAQIGCARTCGRCKQGSPIDGGYTQWSLWSLCSKPCGGGTQIRNRSCTNPPPTNGRKGCSGQGRAKQSRICNKFSCSVCRNSLDDGYCNKKKKSCSNNSEFRQYCKLTCEVCSVPVQSVLSSIQSPKN